MVKMLILFKNPPLAERDEFEQRWASEFLPLAESMPGLQRVAVGHVVGSPTGDSAYTRAHEFYFEDQSSLDAALGSPIGVQAGRTLMSFAAGLAQILFLNVYEDHRIDILRDGEADILP